MNQLTGKVAIITGAASGMGKATAILFARQGANVLLADLNTEGGEEAAKLASEAGPRCVFQRTDVSSESDVAAMVGRAMSEFGRLDVTFNNAGVGGAVGSLEAVTLEDWDRTQSICLRGAFLGIKHSVAAMRASGGGSIISTASIAAFHAFPHLHAYGAAKAGVINLTRSAAIEFAPDFIRVNCVSPGNILTPMVYGVIPAGKAEIDDKFAKSQPIPRAGQPDDIANAALYLASDASSFVTGVNLTVDGGITLGAVSGGVTRAVAGGAAPAAPRANFIGPSFQV
jgi:NAD(P)-dependent dehydrogenase (short-subunit alcohol dehydrogenase family)